MLALNSTRVVCRRCGSGSRQSFTRASHESCSPLLHPILLHWAPPTCFVIYAHYAHEASYLPLSSFGLLEKPDGVSHALQSHVQPAMQLRIRGPMLIEVTETFAAGNEIVPGGRSDRCSGRKNLGDRTIKPPRFQRVIQSLSFYVTSLQFLCGCCCQIPCYKLNLNTRTSRLT